MTMVSENSKEFVENYRGSWKIWRLEDSSENARVFKKFLENEYYQKSLHRFQNTCVPNELIFNSILL